MGIDDVDKRFQAKPSSLVRLECRNCGKSPDDVQVLLPLWYTTHEKMALCGVCSRMTMPTNPDLVQMSWQQWNDQQNTALEALLDRWKL